MCLEQTFFVKEKSQCFHSRLHYDEIKIGDTFLSLTDKICYTKALISLSPIEYHEFRGCLNRNQDALWSWSDQLRPPVV